MTGEWEYVEEGSGPTAHFPLDHEGCDNAICSLDIFPVGVFLLEFLPDNELWQRMGNRVGTV